MRLMLPFFLNSLLNFAVGLLVAKALGPTEYGRFMLTLAVAVVLQTLVFDWLRHAATRFYSERARSERPEIRATLNASFAALAAFAVIVALAFWTLRPSLPISPGLAASAIAVSLANALFDFSTALLRARFHDGAYGALVVAKNVLAVTLTVGGAVMSGSADVALIGMTISVAGSLVVGRRELADPDTGFGKANGALLRRFLAYGLPIILAAVLYQIVPLANRALLSHTDGFAEVGLLSLAFEMGVRIVGAIGAAIDVILFQIAVRTEHADGADAARAQISRNLAIVFAILLPAIAGVWLILPSFEALFVPNAFRGHFIHYFSVMTPALFAFAMMNYGVNTAFQLAHRMAPLIIAALVALVANFLALDLLPATRDATRFAQAQSISSMSGLAALVAMLLLLERMRPRARDIYATLAATSAMMSAGVTLRGLPPGVTTLIMQIGAGASVYGLLAYVLDIAELRSLIAARLAARRRAASLRAQ